MYRNIFLLVFFSLVLPYLVTNQPLYTSKDQKTVIHALIPYGETQFFDGRAPLSPSIQHPLGTDDRGRDLLVRTLYGLRNGFLYSLCLSLLIMLIACLMGVGSVLLIKPLNSLFLLLTESTLNFPTFFILLLFLSVFDNAYALFLFCLLFMWPPTALLIRSETIKVSKENYILSARILGVSHLSLILFHVLPNCLTPLRTAFPFIFSSIFSLLTYVHYLGITTFEPSASLGELLNESRHNLEHTTLVLAPLLATLLPIFLLFPRRKDKVLFKKLQVRYLSYLQWMDKFFGEKNRFSRFIKLPQ